ncbi:MAG: response regulator [Desulfatiglandales bacterium]
MQDTFTVLIADRNPNVRELLRRELVAEGFRVQLAKSSREVMNYMQDASREPDLLVIDPDLPDKDEIPLLEVISELAPDLPVVIHTFLADYIHQPAAPTSAPVIEKDGKHLDQLKHIVRNLLGKSYPQESQPADKTLNTEH